MSADSQWPRYQVFLQEKQGEPHHDVGSVHAPDSEIALQNARDVFVRRPACTNLWVVPAKAILSKTAEQLESWSDVPGKVEPGEDEVLTDRPAESYFVFNKVRSAGMQTLVGRVSAKSPDHALAIALQKFSNEPPAFVWWVIPERLVVASDPHDTESLFAPSLDKQFRMPTDFHTVSEMRKIRAIKENQREDEST